MNSLLKRGKLSAALISASIGATLGLNGCATQAPPPPVVKIAPPRKEIDVPPDPYAGLPADVSAAIRGDQTLTLENGITTLFPYSPDIEWTVYCHPLRATEIRLNADEVTDKDDVILGDSVRWGIRVGATAVMVEPLATPADPNMTTNLVIHTNKRSYHLLLHLRSHYMDAVAWYYPSEVKAAEQARQTALKQVAAAGQTAVAVDRTTPTPAPQEVSAQ
jgi:type IV secretory pathway VirB9-like protein